MVSWIDLSGDSPLIFAADALRGIWSEVGFVAYSVNSTDGPSLSYMMVV